MSKASHLIKTIGLIGLGRVSAQVVALALLPIYTTFLTPGEYGIVDLLLTYVTLLSPAFTLQLEYGMFRFLINERGRKSETLQIISTATLAMLALGAVWILVGIIVASIVGDRIVLYFLALLTTSMAFSATSQMARGLGRNRLYASSSIIVAVSTLIAVCLFVALDRFSFEIYFWIIPACSALGTVVLFAGLSLHKYLRRRAFSLTLLKRLIGYSIPLIPNSISWWVISASGRTVAVIFLGVASVGLYAVATKFASIVTGFATVFSYAWMESASLHIDSPDRPRFFSKVVNEALRAFTALTILVIALVPVFFSTLIDSQFSGAYPYIPILLVGALANAMVSFYSGVLIAQQDTKRVASTSLMAAAISIVLSLSLVHFIGLYAIAVATSVAFVSMSVYRHLTSRSVLQIRYRISTLVLVPIALLFTMAAYYLSPEPWLVVVVGVLCAVALTHHLAPRLFRNLRSRRSA